MKAGAFLLMHEAKKESRDLITALSWIGDAWVRIPMKPAIDSETKPATCSDFIPASIPF